MESIGLTHQEEFDEERIGTLVLDVHSITVGVEPLLCFSQPTKGEKSKVYGLLGDSFDGQGYAYLQKVLEMCVSILMGLPIERTSLHHCDQR